MKKLFIMTLALLFCTWVHTRAEEGTTPATVKMTYVNFDEPDKAYGEILAGETATSGYNKINKNEVVLANTGWEVNYITYLQVTVPAIQGNITGVTLSFEASGSTDSKRATTWGLGYNSSVWTSDMTYNTADKSITTFGETPSTTTTSKTSFEKLSFDITDVIKNVGENESITLLVYETAPAGGYIKNPSVDITWTTASTYDVTFSETSGTENVTVTVNGSDVTSGASLTDGIYKFTATAYGYKDYTGEFTVAGANLNVEFAMVPKAKWSYSVKNNVNDQVKTGTSFEGESVTEPFSRYILADDGTVWMKSVGNTSSYTVSFTPDKDDYEYAIEYSKTDITDGIFFKEAEDEYYDGILTSAATAGNRGSNYLGGYGNGVLYTLKPGTYNFKFTAFSSAKTPATLKLMAGEKEIISVTPGTKFEETSTPSPVDISEETPLTIEGTDKNNVLDYILITGEVKSIADYTIKFVDENGVEIKPAVTGSGFVGTAIEIPEEDKKDFTDEDGTPYIFDGVEPETPTIGEEGTTITVKYHKMSEVKYTVKFSDQDGKEIKEAEERTGDAGSSAAISEEDKKDLVIEGVTYVYASDNTKDLTYSYDGSTVVIITYNKVVDYTIKFVDEKGNEIKAPETKSGPIGSEITLPENYLKNIYVDGKRYIFVSNDLASNPTITAEGTIVTITYRLPEIGEVITILDQTFATNELLTESSEYIWGEDLNINGNGLYMTNSGNAANNYEDKDFITFTNPIGGENQEVNISYSTYMDNDFGQKYCDFQINYFNSDNEFVFGIHEYIGDITAGNNKTWEKKSYIVTANENAEKTFTELPKCNVVKKETIEVNLDIKFSGNNAVIAIGGNSYSAYTASPCIKSIKLSVTNGSDQGRGLNIKNFVVKTTEVEPITIANYTINYVCDGVSIKEETQTAEIGSEISLTEAQTSNFFNEDETVKYIYVSNDADGQTVASDGSTVVTITYREAATWNYTVKNNVNADEVKGSVLEGEGASVAFHRYILEDGKVYINDPGSRSPYTYAFTPDKDGYEATIEYKEYVDDAIYFVEAEDIEGINQEFKNASARSSYAGGGYTGEEPVTVYTLQPGTYTVEMASMGGKSGDTDVVYTVKAGEETIIEDISNGSWHKTAKEFTVKTETELTIVGGTASKPFDYILITGTEFGEATGIEITDKEGQKIETLELVSGEEYQLGAAITPEHVSDDTVNWSSADETVATVDENGKVTAIANGKKTTITATCGNVSASIVVKSHAQVGDAKMDGKVEINDAIDIANYVVGKKIVADEDLDFYRKAANANGDEEGLITFADASATVKIALDAETSASTQSRIRADYDESADALVIGRASTGSRGTVIPVSLENAGAYVAFQADIILPEGMDVEVKAADAVAATHTLMTKKHADNHIRVALFNFGGNAFAAGEVPVIEIVTDSFVSASDIVITDIIASDADANASVLASKTAATNGVAAIGLDGDAPVKVYDINGIYVSDTMEGLQQGTYIVRQGETAKTVRIR